MKTREVDFLRRLVVDRPNERRSDLAHQFSREEGLGLVQGTKVIYRPLDFERAASLIATRGFGLESPPPGFARSEAPHGGSEKSGARAIAQDLVAVLPIGMDVPSPHDGFLAMPWQSAISLQYQVLLVCENLETFLQLKEYLWLVDLIKGRPALALFRGMVHTFGTDAAARLIAHDHRPTLAFFDFDPRGLAMAASLPRREALCLPSWELLEPSVREARRDHLYTNSYHGSRAQLDKEQDPAIALAWQRLKLLTKGLNQEAFPRSLPISRSQCATSCYHLHPDLGVPKPTHSGDNHGELSG